MNVCVLDKGISGWRGWMDWKSIFLSKPKCQHLDSRSTHHLKELPFSSTPGHWGAKAPRHDTLSGGADLEREALRTVIGQYCRAWHRLMGLADKFPLSSHLLPQTSPRPPPVNFNLSRCQTSDKPSVFSFVHLLFLKDISFFILIAGAILPLPRSQLCAIV